MFDEVWIAEKPDVAKAIAEYMGGTRVPNTNGYIQIGNVAITWCFGHMIALAKPNAYGAQYQSWDDALLPIVPVEFIWEPDPEKLNQLNVIGRLISNTKVVVHGADPGREGQLIVDLCLKHFNYRGVTKRLWLNANDEGSVKKAMKALKDNKDYSNLSEAAFCRAKLDWTLGMNFSRAVTNSVRRGGSTMTIPIGRVITPTLWLIVIRELEIKQFIPTKYYFPEINVNVKNGSFMARWIPDSREQVDSEGRLLDRVEAVSIVEAAISSTGKITKVESDKKRVAPPKPHMLGTLQGIAAKRFGFTAQKTLDVAQSLYEIHKVISYPRTECQYLPETQFFEAPANLARLVEIHPALADICKGANTSLRSPAWNQVEVDKEEHHGLIPTRGRADTSYAKFSDDEKLIFDVIALVYIAQFYPYYEYDRTLIEAQFGYAQKFAATGYTLINEGWREILKLNDEDEKVKLPIIELSEPCTASSYKIQNKVTSPPPRYDDGSLVEAMSKVHLLLPTLVKFGDDMANNQSLVSRLKDTAGLGTAATRAETINSIVEKKLTRQDKKGVHTPSEQAMVLLQTLPNSIKSPCLTAYFEQELNSIRLGELSAVEYMERQFKWIAKQVSELKKSTLKLPIQKSLLCPGCGKAELSKRKTIDKKTKEERVFWGCSSYPICKCTYPDLRGKPDVSDLKVPM